MGQFTDIQNEVVARFNIKLEPDSKCKGRMHAHIKERKVCKWHQKNSVQATFELFHEIGHIMTYHSTMRRCESEYYATLFALRLFDEYGLTVPTEILTNYQIYVLEERARGIRRGGNLPKKKDLMFGEPYLPNLISDLLLDEFYDDSKPHYITFKKLEKKYNLKSPYSY